MKVIVFTTAAAKTAIVAFGLNQIEMTKAANTRRGIPKRMFREQRDFIAQLLKAITGDEPTTEDVDEIIERLG